MGDADDETLVDIKIFSRHEVYLDATGVLLGETVSALASNAGVHKLKSKSSFEISLDGELLQEGFFHTSCSQPLAIGNRFGSLDVVGIGNELGNGNVNGSVDVEYTITVTNPNAQTLSVFVSDPMLGIAEYHDVDPDGGQIEIMSLASIDGPTSNTVTVEATLQGQVCNGAEASAEITQQAAPPLPDICTRSIQGTILRYIGPDIPGPGRPACFSSSTRSPTAMKFSYSVRLSQSASCMRTWIEVVVFSHCRGGPRKRVGPISRKSRR